MRGSEILKGLVTRLTTLKCSKYGLYFGSVQEIDHNLTSEFSEKVFSLENQHLTNDTQFWLSAYLPCHRCPGTNEYFLLFLGDAPRALTAVGQPLGSRLSYPLARSFYPMKGR